MTRGDLSEIPFHILLHALAVYRRSVVLSIERRQVKKEIILENGTPVDCQSNLLQDTLGKFMVGRGDITEEVNLQVLSKSATTGQPFSEILVAEGLVSANDLYKVLQQNLAKKLLDGFTWRSGSFTVSSQLPPVESPLKVNAPQLVLTGISKLAPEAEIAAAMESIEGEKFFINPGPPFPLKELRLSRGHQEIVGLVSVGKTIAELEAESGMPRDRVLRFLYSLAVIGVAVPEAWLQETPTESIPDMDFASATEEVAAPAQTDAPTALPPDADRLRNEVMELYLRYRKLDAFDLLGIPVETNREVVESGYLEFCEKFAPWKFDHPELQNMKEKARDLFIAGGHAFGELSNPETRNSLVARRNSKFRQLSSEEAREAFAIKSNLLDADEQFKKGMLLVKAGKFAEAIEQLQFAHDCEPQNATYRAELAFCRYRKDPQLEGEGALQELQETVRIDPDCGLALYYLGMMHGEAGDFDAAEPLLQSAIKLMKPDRRPIDALKEFKAKERDKPKKKRLFF
jgi:tetratricopeptide (TPR) repeat protein